MWLCSFFRAGSSWTFVVFGLLVSVAAGPEAKEGKKKREKKHVVHWYGHCASFRIMNGVIYSRHTEYFVWRWPVAATDTKESTANFLKMEQTKMFVGVLTLLPLEALLKRQLYMFHGASDRIS